MNNIRLINEMLMSFIEKKGELKPLKESDYKSLINDINKSDFITEFEEFIIFWGYAKYSIIGVSLAYLIMTFLLGVELEESIVSFASGFIIGGFMIIAFLGYKKYKNPLISLTIALNNESNFKVMNSQIFDNTLYHIFNGNKDRVNQYLLYMKKDGVKKNKITLSWLIFQIRFYQNLSKGKGQ